MYQPTPVSEALTQEQILLNQALESLKTLRKKRSKWSRLNFCLSTGSEIDLNDAIDLIEAAREFLDIDPKLINLNPDDLPPRSWEAQVNFELQLFLGKV
ncbi:hypothetical protein [Nostoc sp. PCC 7107]|uniref:hypothetical protein n=1 Tax=Nostoc sp. PCC 7107 TaxID=317936 RepID=UPI00029F0474|nr:hypothetical protein [Nostoc sp. PCC 7107]AFY45476.1 hypothetical protein Nos7107_4958 [Nostoc sp. PCC 7107]